MSWSPDLFIGEFRPWPDTVHVVRGKTDEMRRYVPEEMLFHERDGHDEQFERARSLEDENARLRSCLSDDAENARMIMGENEKLRKMAKECHELLQDLLAGCSLHPFTVEVMEQRMRELGIEVVE